jgi:phosphoribosylglycinamide formyltransferase-1
MKILNLGFLCSHSGSNMQAIIDNVKQKKLIANLCVVISNNSNAFALERAKKENIPAYVINEKTNPNNVDNEIARILKQHNVDTIILAGYMKIVSPQLIESFNKQILNIHPALLPKFGGQGMYGINVHRAVIDAKETKSGATIHQVDSEYDKGRILAQMEVEVLKNDTPETLSERILAIEHILYSDTLIKISNEEILFP